MRISDWSSDVCSSDLRRAVRARMDQDRIGAGSRDRRSHRHRSAHAGAAPRSRPLDRGALPAPRRRSEEHTSELQSLMRISYAVFCLKKKTTNTDERAKHATKKNTTTHATSTPRSTNNHIYRHLSKDD